MPPFCVGPMSSKSGHARACDCVKLMRRRAMRNQAAMRDQPGYIRLFGRLLCDCERCKYARTSTIVPLFAVLYIYVFSPDRLADYTAYNVLFYSDRLNCGCEAPTPFTCCSKFPKNHNRRSHFENVFIAWALHTNLSYCTPGYATMYEQCSYIL